MALDSARRGGTQPPHGPMPGAHACMHQGHCPPGRARLQGCKAASPGRTRALCVSEHSHRLVPAVHFVARAFVAGVLALWLGHLERLGQACGGGGVRMGQLEGRAVGCWQPGTGAERHWMLSTCRHALLHMHAHTVHGRTCACARTHMHLYTRTCPCTRTRTHTRTKICDLHDAHLRLQGTAVRGRHAGALRGRAGARCSRSAQRGGAPQCAQGALRAHFSPPSLQTPAPPGTAACGWRCRSWSRRS